MTKKFISLKRRLYISSATLQSHKICYILQGVYFYGVSEFPSTKSLYLIYVRTLHPRYQLWIVTAASFSFFLNTSTTLKRKKRRKFSLVTNIILKSVSQLNLIFNFFQNGHDQSNIILNRNLKRGQSICSIFSNKGKFKKY